jgi:flagellar biosynthetic protein FlhB
LEKTERATTKKRNNERKKGHVMHSREIITAICSLIMFALMYITFPSYAEGIRRVFVDYLGAFMGAAVTHEFSQRSMGGLYTSILTHILLILAPILGTALVVGVGANVLQKGFMFNTEAIKFKPNKLNPINGFKRMFSLNSVIELLKSILKVGLMGFIAYKDYIVFLPEFSYYMQYDLATVFIEFMRRIFFTAIKMSAVLLIVAAFDYLYQWWKFEKDMKMSKQEVKDEYKQDEGDPKVKGKIKQKMRQMSAQRMMERVPSADVVITNPTHLAIALRYEDGVDAAPIVIAKGADHIAKRIKEQARIYGVPTVENVPLAHALYDSCEIDDTIPEELFQAVADILVEILRSGKGAKRAA